jgi:hypothetical protein
MKNGALILLIILLLGLVLCCVLGGARKEGFQEKIQEKTGVSTTTSKTEGSGFGLGVSKIFDNYNHFDGSSIPTTFYGSNGSTATVSNDGGEYSLVITNSNGSTTTYSSSQPNTNNLDNTSNGSSNGSSITEKTYYGPNGGRASVYKSSGGDYVVEIVDQNGNKTVYSSSMDAAYSNGETTKPSSSTTSLVIKDTTFYGPNGGSARVITGSEGKYIIKVLDSNGNENVYTSNTMASRNNYATTEIKNATFYGPNGGSARVITGNSGDYVIEITGPNGNKLIYSSKADSGSGSGSDSNYSNPYYYNGNNYNYYNNDVNAGSINGPNGNTLSYATGPNGNAVAGANMNNSNQNGISASAIPEGDEDLYILKSQVVPPVCPACPSSASCPRQEKCPPCPACARCPEPSFECKKVPNYNNINDNYLPMPVLNDFSTFGT